ncbi:hypothetical protein PLICBS_007527 [Purpureocillium lilacinum]|uniref:uncharacterized protein n=1 Tax=Purpureocillium lilacinum TaxID=33203 RepID=UPI00207E5D8C|nr:hypothetical protein PLICBS_007527 [Purpureocillium lilacinum]
MAGVPEPDFRVLSFMPQKGNATARRYQKRKAHRKSKEGCIACKVKRVKRQHYPSADEASSPESSSQVAKRPSAHIRQMCRMLGRRSMPSADLLTSPAVTGLDMSQEPTHHGIPRIVLIQHFQNLYPELQLLDSGNPNPILALGLVRPFLLEAVLAVSASHLRHHHWAPESRQLSRVTEHFQQALAVRSFRDALQSLTLDQQTADAFVLTSMFLNLLTFSFAEDDQVQDTWLFRPDDPERLSWFSLQLGLKPLLLTTEHYRDDTILSWMYAASDDEKGTFYGENQRMDRVPAHWMAFLGLDRENLLGEDDLLREPARMLAEVRDLEPRDECFFLYVNFVGALDMEFRFRDMLEAEDERAVWLFGYWLGLMCRFGWWWMQLRVDREWRAIRLWLDQKGVRDRPGEQGRVWRLLMHELEDANRWPRTEYGVVDEVHEVPSTDIIEIL